MSEEKTYNAETARQLFYSKHYKEAELLFAELQMPYETGLCQLLVQRPEDAAKTWKNSKNQCAATRWGLIVLDLINLKYRQNLCFFQIRAFLEVYLNLFLENKLIKYTENVISAYEILSKHNYESCKFIARALYAHNYIDAALDFMGKSRAICHPDPEGILIEAQCFFRKKMYDKSLLSLEELFKFIPEYLPAVKLKKEILMVMGG